MKRIWTRGMQFGVALMLMLFFALLIWGAILPGPNRPDAAVEPVTLWGEFSADGGPWAPLSEGALPDCSSMAIRGHLNRTVEKGEVLFLFLDNVSCRMALDGETVYSFGEAGSYPPRFSTPGNTIGFYISPGITPEDSIEFSLQCNEPMQFPGVYEKLLSNLKTGTVYALYAEMLSKHGVIFLLCFVILFTGLWLLLLSLMWYRKEKQKMYCGVCFAFFAVCGALYMLIDAAFAYLPLLIPNPILCNVADMGILFLSVPAYCLYFHSNLILDRTRRMMAICSLLSVLVAIIGFSAQLLGIFGIYSLHYAVLPPALLGCICGLYCLGYEWIKHKNTTAGFTLLSFLPLALAVPLESANIVLLHFMPRRMFIDYAIGFTILLQGFQIVRFARRREAAAKRQQQMETELLQSRVAIMLSQIQPHFLYNALNTIKYLCDTHDDRAGETVANFSKFLRGNMDSLSCPAPIPFAQEMVHLQHYLEIEKLRFQDVTFAFDLRATDFLLPALTVQPLVENAINHGVRGRMEGGTVAISSWEDDHAWHVQVKDDGNGFDPDRLPDDGRSHVGIQNTRDRLAAMCRGTLRIESIDGVGTTVEIIVPKGDTAG